MTPHDQVSPDKPIRRIIETDSGLLRTVVCIKHLPTRSEWWSKRDLCIGKDHTNMPIQFWFHAEACLQRIMIERDTYCEAVARVLVWRKEGKESELYG